MAARKAATRVRERAFEGVPIRIAKNLELDQRPATQKLGIIYGLYNVPDYAERFGLMNDDKWQSSIDILAGSGDLPKKPTAKEMYTNAIVESLDEAKTLSRLIREKATN